MPLQDNDAIRKHLLATFRVEADEHLKAMAALLQELEKGPAERQPPLVEAFFREAHSLKGAARSVSQSAVEMASKGLEGELAAVKRQERALSPDRFGWFHRSLDHLADLLATTDEQPGTVSPPPLPTPTGSLGAPLREEEFLNGSETVRISTDRLTALLVQAEELLGCKSSASHLEAELKALTIDMAQWQESRGMIVSSARGNWRARAKLARRRHPDDRGAGIDKILDALDRDDDWVRSLSERLIQLQSMAERDRRALAGLVDGLQDQMKQALMQPLASLLDALPQLARELARDSGKEVELRIEGPAIELDRRILEQMKDPFIHLLRNAIDHGIEMPAERIGRRKPAQGQIAITVEPLGGNKLELRVTDDGAGIDLEKVKSAAVKLGLVATEQAESLAAADLLEMLFESGLTTSAILTDLSGRGLGLAIVREKVDKLGGSVSAALPDHGGTQFHIMLPTTLANFHGVLVALGECHFVLPSRHVDRVARVSVASIRTMENREAVEIDGEAVAFVRLADILGLQCPAAPEGNRANWQVAVLENAGKRVAFGVDAILGDQEVLVKGLGPQLKRVPNVAGATVLGNGKLVPILSVPDLLKSAARTTPRGAVPAPMPAAGLAPRRSLLVVEDSITSRSLLKNILESAGYRVATAVDGIDALTQLRTEPFDLVVSDVEMPRMNGFDLTAKLRQEKALADLPVVLVTALESREDKERGIEVGANAYIVKSSFDQSNLLEVIGRLI